MKKFFLSTGLCMALTAPALAQNSSNSSDMHQLYEQLEVASKTGDQQQVQQIKQQIANERQAWMAAHPDVAQKVQAIQARQDYLKAHPDEYQKFLADRRAQREAWLNAHPEVAQRMTKRQTTATPTPPQPTPAQAAPAPTTTQGQGGNTPAQTK